MKKIISLLMVFVMLLSSVSVTHALTPIAKKWVKVVKSSKVDTTPPKWFKPSDSEDINYWLGVLPSKKDANYSQYMVIPAMWLVSPIVQTPKTIKDKKWKTINNPDYTNAIAGKAVDFNKYFSLWVHQYPGTPDIGTKWNTVLWWHSNYYVSKRTNYTTIFWRLPELDKNDQVWFFKKQSDGKWMLLKYKVEKSYETKPTDVNVIAPMKIDPKTKKASTSEFTAYTCVPIGTAKNRWIVKWELVEVKLFDNTKTTTTTSKKNS